MSPSALRSITSSATVSAATSSGFETIPRIRPRAPAYGAGGVRWVFCTANLVEPPGRSRSEAGASMRGRESGTSCAWETRPMKYATYAAAALIAALAIPSALAAGHDEAEGNFGVGIAFLAFDDYSESGITVELDDTAALQLRSGADVNEYLGIEGSFFTSSPDFTARSATVEVTGSIRYWGAGLSLLLSPGGDMKFEPFAKVSARYLNASVEVLGTTVSEDGFEPGFGAGVDAHLTDNMSLRAEIERIEDEVIATGLSVAWAF